MTKVETIDMTPTWSALLPAMVAVVEDGSFEGREMVKPELARMAQVADRAVTYESRIREALALVDGDSEVGAILKGALT